MMKIADIWIEQEHDNSTNGLLLRRCSSYVLPDVFIGFRKVEQQRCIALKLDKSSKVDLTNYTNLKDIKPEFRSDEIDSEKIFLLIILINAIHEDVFATLCEDLISGVAGIKEDAKVVRELLNRLEKWKSLFDKASNEGLSIEEQRGLYGELYFLRKYLAYSKDFLTCLQAWVGPEKAIRDFQLLDWALEVKTTFGNNHQKILISSERQLDPQNLTALYLYHLSLEVQQKNGEALNDIIDRIIIILSKDALALSKFRFKLLQAGYFNHQKQLYELSGYQVRDSNYYYVKEQFPRIEEKDIRKGVGDVKYSIILSEYKDYTIEESHILKAIN